MITMDTQRNMNDNRMTAAKKATKYFIVQFIIIFSSFS